jgi:hypothetical protein
MKQVLINDKGDVNRDWQKLESAVLQKKDLTKDEREIALSHTANILGRTFKEVSGVYAKFSSPEKPERFLDIIYWLGKLALDEILHENNRTVTFSSVLRETLGQHIHGERWADNIKEKLHQQGLLGRPIHIISANMHSVQNTLYAPEALKTKLKGQSKLQLFEELSANAKHRDAVIKVATKEGMTFLKDTSGTNIDVQIFNTAKYSSGSYADRIKDLSAADKPVIIVMDYAFGEQAYETMDELLKSYKPDDSTATYLNVASISIMGKAGILTGGKGDIMIPSSHVFEGTADNYPFENGLQCADLEGNGVGVYDGAMISVLGTSLQNKDLLRYFNRSTWGVVGLEMEGAHYQKATPN